MPNFYEALKQERIKRHLTQEEMANLLGIKRSTYSLYESGKRMPKTDTLDKIAEALDVLIYYDHEAHQYQFITFEDGQTIHTIRIYDSAQENTENFQKKIENEREEVDYDNSYSYASSEEEFNRLQSRNQIKSEEMDYKLHKYDASIHTEVTPEQIEISRIQNKILNDKEHITEEELKKITDYYHSNQFRKSFKRLQETAEKGLVTIKRLQEACEQLNEDGQKKVAEHAEMIAKIPEYQKKPDPPQD